jgi:hypothetical protein
MNYSEVLSRAWQIIWKHKVLWVFGILAGCARSSSGGGNFTSGRNFNPSTSQQFPAEMQNYFEQMRRFFESIPQQTWILIGVGAVLLFLVLLVLKIFFGTAGTIGLIHGAQRADQEIDARLPFGELFSESLAYFWRVFLLNLLVFVVVFIVAMIIGVFAIFGALITLGIGLICLLPLICLLIPVGIAVNVIVEQATIAIVVENLDIMNGLRRGWEVVKTYIGPMIIMWLILDLSIRIVIGLIIAFPLIVIFIPFVIGLFSGAQQGLQTGLIVTLICCAGYLPVLILLQGILESYVRTAWTLTFLRLTRPAPNTPELPSAPELPGTPEPPAEPAPTPLS